MVLKCSIEDVKTGIFLRTGYNKKRKLIFLDFCVVLNNLPNSYKIIDLNLKGALR